MGVEDRCAWGTHTGVIILGPLGPSGSHGAVYDLRCGRLREMSGLGRAELSCRGLGLLLRNKVGGVVWLMPPPGRRAAWPPGCRIISFLVNFITANQSCESRCMHTSSFPPSYANLFLK